MEIHKFVFENKELVQVYITEEENEDKKILEKIQKLKTKGLNVTIFVSKKVDTIKILEEVLNYEKSKNIE